MCYKVSTPKRYLAEAAYNFANPYENWNSSHDLANGFANPNVPAIVNYKDAYRFIDFEMGFIRRDYSNLDNLQKYRSGTINAKGETVFTTYSYKESILSRRCLIIVDGFFESHKLDKKISIPYYFTLKDREVFALAGIWDAWKHPISGDMVRTCSILTTRPNELCRIIHNKVDEFGNPDPRMPVIMSKEDELSWLDPTIGIDGIKALIKTYPNELMQAHSVSPLANSRKEDPNVPQVKAYYDYLIEGFRLVA